MAPHKLDEGEVRLDSKRPGRPTVRLQTVAWAFHSVTRTEGDGVVTITSSTCSDEPAFADVQVLAAADDRTPVDLIGYKWHVTGGKRVPKGLIPQGGAERLVGGTIRITWSEPNGPEPVDFELVVNAIDLAGNESRGSRRLRIVHVPED